MPFSGPGAGTQQNPYLISTVQHVKDISESDVNVAGVVLHFDADVDVQGEVLSRIFQLFCIVRMQGYELINVGINNSGFVGAVESGAEWSGGHINASGVSSRTPYYLFNEVGGTLKNMKLSGNLETTDPAGVIYGVSSTGVGGLIENIVCETTIKTGGTAGVVRQVAGQTCKNIIYTGTIDTSLSPTINLFTIIASSNQVRENFFYDSTINNDASIASDYGEAKTTTELQTLATYTGATPAFDMVYLSNFTGTQEWAIADAENSYPVLGWEPVVAAQPNITIAKDGVPLQGAIVKFIQMDPFALDGADRTTVFQNFTELPGVFVTNPSGYAQYDGVFDSTKVQMAIWLNAEYDTEWKVEILGEIGSENINQTTPI